MTIIFGILLFSLLIFVHELGHFVAAKLSGVQVNEFSMFMGPAIWKKQVGETLYALRCIPIGGYCAMEGEDTDTENPRSFQKAAWWKRLIILVAGAAMNFLVGVLIFSALFLPGDQIKIPAITEFTDCCIFNHENGLRTGDEIVELDGERIYVIGDVSMMLQLNQTTHHDIVVIRDGQRLEFTNLEMGHIHLDEKGQRYIHYGISFGEVRTVGFFDKVKYVGAVTVDNVRNVRLSLQMLFSGEAGVQDLAGPVGIVDMMSDVAETSASSWIAFLNMLSFGGMIAINLGVMNLLPFPALDGGRVVGLLLTTAVEAITKKKINPKYEGYLHGAGMILLLALMAIILFKDIFVIVQR